MMVIKLIVFILIFAFGTACIYACLEKKETFLKNESLIFSVGLATVLISVVAMVLAVCGFYHLKWCLLLFAFISVVILLITYHGNKSEIMQAFQKKKCEPDYFLAAIVLVAAVLYLSMPTYYMWSGRDYGLYYVNAIHTAKTGSIDYETDTWLNEHYEELSDVIKLGYPAYYSSYEAGISKNYGDLNPQFLPLYWCLLSIGYSIAGNVGLYAITGLLSVLSLAVMYAFMHRFFGKKYAVLATALLAICPAQIWGARITQSEQMIQLLFFLAVALFGIGWQQKKNAWLYVGTLCIGFGCFCRMDNYLMGLAVFVVAIYAILFQQDRVKSTMLCVMQYTIMMVVSVAYGFWMHYGYYRGHWDYGVLKKLIYANCALLIATLVIFICNSIIHKSWQKKHSVKYQENDLQSQHKNHIATGLMYKMTSIIAAACVGSVFVFFYFIRTYAMGINYFPQFCYYFCPLMLIFFVAGVYCLLQAKSDVDYYHNIEPILLWLVIGSAYCLLYSYSPAITMDHYFMSRRWVPVNFPFIICMGVIGYFKCVDTIKISVSSEKVKKTVIGIATAMMLAIGAYIAARDVILVYKVAYKGIEQTFANVAEAIPDDAIVLTDKESVASTLRYVYGKNVYWINWEGSTDELSRYVEQHDDIYYLGKFSTSHIKDAVCADAVYAGTIGGVAPESCYDHYPKHNQEFFVPASLYRLKPIDQFELDLIPEVDTFASTQKEGNELVMSGQGIGFYGPYCNLEPGDYTLQMDLAETTNEGSIGTLEIVLDENVVNTVDINAQSDTYQIPIHVDDASQVLQTRFVKETEDTIRCTYLMLLGE